MYDPDDETVATLRAQICKALRADHSSAFTDAEYVSHGFTALSVHQSTGIDLKHKRHAGMQEDSSCSCTLGSSGMCRIESVFKRPATMQQGSLITK